MEKSMSISPVYAPLHVDFLVMGKDWDFPSPGSIATKKLQTPQKLLSI
jgi:hypothetical protein